MKGAVCLGACGPNARVHRAQTSSTRLIDVQADPGPFHCRGCIHRNMFMLTNWWDKTPNPKLFSFFSVFYLTWSRLLCFWWKTFCSIKWQSREVLLMREKNVKGEIMSHPFSHEIRDAKYCISNLLRSWKPLKERHHREARVEVLSLEFCVKITQKMRRLTLILLF